MPKLVVLKQTPPPKTHKGHAPDWSEQQFVNRPDIKFRRCEKCGHEEYPDNAVRVFGGTHIEIMWPT